MVAAVPGLTPGSGRRGLLDHLAPLVLAAGLVLPVALPELANIAVLVLAGLALLMVRNWRGTLALDGVRLVLVGLALVSACILITARSPEDVLGLLVFAPALAVMPLTRLFQRNRDVAVAGKIGLAAGTGALLALVVALWDALVIGVERAGLSVNNPIHFADLALTLALVSLAGLYARSHVVTGLVVLAQFAVVIAILLSASRGAMVAAVPCYGLALALLLGDLRRSRRTIVGLVLVAMLSVLGLLVAWQLGYLDRMIDMVTGLVTGTIDESNRQRLAMYFGAWGAFQASPIWGHGIVGMVDAAIAHAPAGVVVPPYEHLHSDLADFVTLGGILGLIAYGLFILAPMQAALRLPAGPMRLVGLVVPVAYVLMGLTNAMLGLITQTVLYTLICALVFSALSQRRAPP